ncbi:Efflux pump FUS6 [Colletotrichum fructicola Nara gc5]|uniref:Efflux pump FUS6 n=1 Tax=Colletotrichum fructicola (strain Nara gc5) TaxID=1213859 RepID=A0A7J6JCB6_COLFN|nr:Efflux pump FUS6 [Colletotrichum fructicola Nara gc5]
MYQATYQLSDPSRRHSLTEYPYASLPYYAFLTISALLMAITGELGGSTLEAFWTNTSMSLSSTVSQPLWVRLSTEKSRAATTLVAVACFITGSSLALMAGSFDLLIAARTAQGLGIGGITALTNLVLLDFVSSGKSAAALGWVSASRALGSAVGPVVGASISERGLWRWIFWIDIPLALFSLVVLPSLVPCSAQAGSSSALGGLAQLDWIGAFVFLASLTGFLIPLTWGGVLFDWVSTHTLLPLCVCLGGLVGFALYSALWSRSPIFDRALFLTANSVVIYANAVFHGVAIFSLLYYLPLYFTIVKGASVLRASLYILPNSVIAAVASTASGAATSRMGRYRPLLWLGWATTTVGCGAQLVLDETTSVAGGVALTLVSGVGIGVLFTTLNLAAQASVPPAHTPAASSTTNFFRSLGQTVGIAVGGVVVQNVFRREIEASSVYGAYGAMWSRNIVKVGQAVRALKSPEQQALKSLVVTGVARSTRAVWLLLCILSGTQFLVSVAWVEDLTLDGARAVPRRRRLSISRPQLQTSLADPAAAGSFVR